MRRANRAPDVTCPVCGRTESGAGQICSLCLVNRRTLELTRTVTPERVALHRLRIERLRKVRGPVIEPGEHGIACICRDTVTGARWFRSATQQQCPCCGWLEPRGSFCSMCTVPTGPRDWYRPDVSQEVIDTLTKARAARVTA